MKQKKNIYILLPVVLVIWGLIGYRMFAGFKKPSEDPKPVEQTKVFKPEGREVNKSFELIADYRDPFLGTLQEKLSNKPRIRKLHVKKQEVIFPQIEYKGIFKSDDRAKTTFLILIEGGQKMFKLRQSHEGVKLIKGDTEKIVVKYKNEKRTYYLEPIN